MNLTTEDRAWIQDLIAASEERSYRRIRDGAVSGLRSEMRDGFASLQECMDGMAEEVAKIPAIEGEVRHVNRRLAGIEERLP